MKLIGWDGCSREIQVSKLQQFYKTSKNSPFLNLKMLRLPRYAHDYSQLNQIGTLGNVIRKIIILKI